MKQIIYEMEYAWLALTMIFGLFSVLFVPMLAHQMITYPTDCNTIESLGWKELCQKMYDETYTIMVVLPTLTCIFGVLLAVSKHGSKIIESPIYRKDALQSSEKV